MRIILLLILSYTVRAQLVVSNFSSQYVNRNFIIEYHAQSDRDFRSYYYIIQFDTIVPRIELQFESDRDLDYFNNYIRCFLTECHRDKQPLILPKLGTLVYNKGVRGYCRPDSKSIYFKRSALVQFAKAIKRNDRKGKRRQITVGWRRYKLFF